jgi:hypothetical protein
MYFVFIYRSRGRKAVEIVLRRAKGGGGTTMERVTLRYIRGTSVNIIMHPSVQLLYANNKRTGVPHAQIVLSLAF